MNEEDFYNKLRKLGYTDEQIKSLLQQSGDDFFTKKYVIAP